jgi:uncharacterized protein YbbC (DUF1343 family)
MLLGCSAQTSNTTSIDNSSSITTGAEQTELYIDGLRGKKVGLIVNQTSLVGNTHLVDTLLSLGVTIHTIFAPEHGFRGNHSAGAKVLDGKDAKTGIPIISLYGKYRTPSDGMIDSLDVIVFDIQDVGVRFYTYISTMHNVMKVAAKLKKEFVVLDRPNPNGFYVDGPMREPTLKSFIGMHPIPLVHGLTVGELSKMIVGEKWIDDAENLNLQVIKVMNYTHDSLYHLPVAPSPNLPTMESIYLYPTLGLFEGTRMSIGRGTSRPFELLGMPDGEGDIVFTPKSIPGVADHPKFKGLECIGVDKGQEVANLLEAPEIKWDWLTLYYQLHELKEISDPFFLGSFNKLAGNEQLRVKITRNQSKEEIQKSSKLEIEEYLVMRSKYLLYEDFTKRLANSKD